MEHSEVTLPGSASLGAGIFIMASWIRHGRVRRQVLSCFVLIMALSLYFAKSRGVSYLLVPCAILPGFCLSLALVGFERLLLALRRRLDGKMRGVQAGFLLFFAYLIGNILFASLFLSMPLCWVMEHLFGQSHLCKEFALFSVNYSLVLALVNWLGWFRNACRQATPAQDDSDAGSYSPWRKHLTMGENLVYFRVFISQVIQRGKRAGAHTVR